jgi:hypothetical protein
MKTACCFNRIDAAHKFQQAGIEVARDGMIGILIYQRKERPLHLHKLRTARIAYHNRVTAGHPILHQVGVDAHTIPEQLII